MLKRSFSNITDSVSILGFGCMRLPTADGKIDFSEAKKMVDLAYSRGVNYFDTAWMYHRGESEEFLGNALSDKPRGSFCLADKMPGWNLNDKGDAEKVFAEQLRRCKTDYFDYYLLHAVHAGFFDRYKKLALDYLIKQKEKGAIRYLGFSFHDAATALSAIADSYPWDFVQIQYNYHDCVAGDAEQLMEILSERKIPAIVMEPVRGGQLASLTPQAGARLLAAAPNKSIVSWAMRYCMGNENVLTVLSGMSTLGQAEDNIKTAESFTPLTQKEHALLLDVCKMNIDAAIVPCTACKYCVDECPSGVDIPEVFAAFNEFFRTNDDIGYKKKLAALKNKGFDACISCGKCATKCPQKIDIPAKMAELRQRR